MSCELALPRNLLEDHGEIAIQGLNLLPSNGCDEAVVYDGPAGRDDAGPSPLGLTGIPAASAAPVSPTNPASDPADLEDFFENGAIGLHMVGGDGIILRANKAELQLLGYAPDEYIGRPIAEFHADPATIADILARLSR